MKTNTLVTESADTISSMIGAGQSRRTSMYLGKHMIIHALAAFISDFSYRQWRRRTLRSIFAILT